MASDTPQPSFELLTYQLGELRAITEGGFAKLDGRIERVEDDVDGVKTRVVRLEVVQEQQAVKASEGLTLPGNDLWKVIGALVLALAAAIGGHAAPL